MTMLLAIRARNDLGLVLAFLTALELCSIASVHAANSQLDADLYARLSTKTPVVKHEWDAQIDAVIENIGKSPVKINTYVLDNPVLSLEVSNNGMVKNTVPPSVPPSDAELKKWDKFLAPGKTERFVYNLHMFSPELKGTFFVRMRFLKSNQLKITIDRKHE